MSVAPAALATAAALLIPGAGIGWCLGFRGLAMWGTAPAFATASVVLASTATPFIGVPWSLIAYLVAAAVVAAAAYFVRRFTLGGELESSKAHRAVPAIRMATVVAAVVSGAVLLWRSCDMIGSPENISQTYDNVFHLNALKYATETGQASSLTVGKIAGLPYYPAAWHALGSLVVGTFQLSVPEATNVVTLVIASVVWPLGAIYLSRTAFPESAVAPVAAAAVACGLGAFPYRLMDFGVLYPNFFAISLLPIVLALAIHASRAVRGSVRKQQLWTVVPALLLASGAVLGAHPSVFVVALACGFAVWLPHVLRRVQVLRASSGHRLRPAMILLAEALIVAVVLAVTWRALRPDPAAAFWGPYSTSAQAVGEAVMLAPLNLPSAWVLGLLLVLGAVSCFLGRYPRTYLLIFALLAALYVVVAGFPRGDFRSILTGVWYNDSYRIAALLPLGALLLVPAGLDASVRWIGDKARRWNRTPKLDLLASGGRVQAIGLIVLLLLLTGATQRSNVGAAVDAGKTTYALTDDAPLVSSDEYQLLRRLSAEVPDGAKIVGNTYNGSPLSYALGDRENVQLHILSPVPPKLSEIYDHLDAVNTDPAVCEAVRSLNAFYVLDFGTREVHGGAHQPSGLKDLDRNPGLELLDEEGPEARLYEITACR
ncbi:DUF6541 family protein [Sinomonas mesophila]|uniref:DUF6541 family protein n=1 Tax=Sinomonas mesophila TaxID=1531955 RepID=UPI000984C14C